MNVHGNVVSRRQLLLVGAAGLVRLAFPASSARADGPTVTPTILTDADRACDDGILLGHACVEHGKAYVNGENISGEERLLTWDVWYAPNAEKFPTGHIEGQYLINKRLWRVPNGPFECCIEIPNYCDCGDPDDYQCDFGRVFTIPPVPLRLFEEHAYVGVITGGRHCVPDYDCRMTGGGRVGSDYTPDGVQVTVSQGFQLRGGIGSKSNLEINYGGTRPGKGVHNFHLVRDPRNFFLCAWTPGEGGEQPQDQPNTLLGYGVGTLDGGPATCLVNFVDRGEPGDDDSRLIMIWEGVVDPIWSIAANAPVLFCEGTIRNGNNQMH